MSAVPSLSQLDNGLEILVLPKADAPVATVWLWMETGTADESLKNAGVAHFVEHLVFKGTARRGVGQVSSDIEGLGGDLNAWITWDHTVLHATVGADFWPEALDVLADMATQSVFDADELERERQVVLDEIRSYDEDVGSVLNDAIREALWPNHAYGKPILGTVDSVTALTRDQVVDYWKNGYAANRATLIVVGPVSP
ncbi:MAG: insulinase family protein, partial [Rhodobacterales bacterium]|nr:insulinase family protein [Rhodobacterales bacterium]